MSCPPHVHHLYQLISPPTLSHTIANSPHPHCNCSPLSTIAFTFSHCLRLVVVYIFDPGLIVVVISVAHAPPPLSSSSNLIVDCVRYSPPPSNAPVSGCLRRHWLRCRRRWGLCFDWGAVRAATRTIKKIVDYEFKMVVAKIKANKQQLTHLHIDANVVIR